MRRPAGHHPGKSLRDRCDCRPCSWNGLPASTRTDDREATSNFNPALYGEIARRVETPLATGERFHTRWGFEQLLKQGAISVIQPDITNCGGLSEAKKICDLAHIYDVRVQCHVAGTPIAEAAAIQLEAAIPQFLHPRNLPYGSAS